MLDRRNRRLCDDRGGGNGGFKSRFDFMGQSSGLLGLASDRVGADGDYSPQPQERPDPFEKANPPDCRQHPEVRILEPVGHRRRQHDPCGPWAS